MTQKARKEDCREFAERIKASFRKNIETVPERWTISEGLRDKVSPDGRFAPFYGYTSVYRLSEKDASRCRAIQDKLLDSHGPMFVPLPEHTFHLTAHEFCNEYTVSSSAAEIDAEEETIEKRIEDLFHKLHDSGRKDVSLIALGPSTSGSDVVSIKFVPKDDEDARILQDIFSESEDIWPVGRPYTPHVSLGYFKTEEFPQDAVESLYREIKALAEETDFTISFSVDDLVYQRHFDMQDFRKIFSVAEM